MPSRAGDLVTVEVAYALPGQQLILPVSVEPGTSLRQAIERSGILGRFPEIDLQRQKIGVFGQVRNPEAPVADGDRIEIYRSLVADPREARRRRAEQGAGKKT
jgi:uncharacterized protein